MKNKKKKDKIKTVQKRILPQMSTKHFNKCH